MSLDFRVLADSINYSDFLVNFGDNVPVVFLKVIGKVFTCVVVAALDPELIDHDHLVVDFKLFLWAENNILNEIKFFADFELLDWADCRFLIFGIYDSTNLFFIYFFEMRLDLLPFFFAEAFVSQTLDGFHKWLHVFGFEKNIWKHVDIIKLDFEFFVICGLGGDEFLEFESFIKEGFDLFLCIFDIYKSPRLAQDFIFIGLHVLMEFPDLLVVGKIWWKLGHRLLVIFFHRELLLEFF